MNSSEKNKYASPSALERLKEKWRALDESEKDYWRKQLDSPRTSLSLRREIGFKLGVLLYSSQLKRFRDWLVSEQERELAAAMMHADLSKFAAPEFKNPGAGPSTGAVRWLYYQCLKDLEQRAMDVMLSRRPRIKPHDFYYDVLCICTLAWLEKTSAKACLN